MKYEVTELCEVGNAAELIQGPKDAILDEVGGNDGPMHQALDDD